MPGVDPSSLSNARINAGLRESNNQRRTRINHVFRSCPMTHPPNHGNYPTNVGETLIYP